MKKQINKVIKKIQDKKKCTRTDALKIIEANYDISYTMLVALAKHGRKPAQLRLHTVISQIIGDYNG